MSIRLLAININYKTSQKKRIMDLFNDSDDDDDGGMGFLKWLIPLTLAGLVFWYFSQDKSLKAKTATPDETTKVEKKTAPPTNTIKVEVKDGEDN